MMEGKEFDSFMRFKTFLDQYSKENNIVYCIADSRTAQYSNKRLPKDSKPFPTKFKYSYAKYACKQLLRFYINGCQGEK